ncbi:MAG: hypothetical protein ACI841_000455 [Planctomycetota bacterium]|jgi:hypothetical protein
MSDGGGEGMQERYENEQYFFSEESIARLGSFAAGFPNPCCICTPKVGEWLTHHGHAVTILDIDERFSSLPGYRHFDLARPEWLGEDFGLILCDPPFYNLSLRKLFAAMRMLSRNDFAQPLLLSYLKRRAHALEGSFGEFGLRASGYQPKYQTVEESSKNEIEFFTNLPSDRYVALLDNP